MSAPDRPLWTVDKLGFAKDLVGTFEQIAEGLYAHAGFREVVFALPSSFEHTDYVHRLTDIATHLGPALGCQPPSA